MNHTHLAELVKKGVVSRRDASPSCSVSQTPMGVPVLQAGRVCSAMKVWASRILKRQGSSRYTKETQLPRHRCVGHTWTTQSTVYAEL